MRARLFPILTPGTVLFHFSGLLLNSETQDERGQGTGREIGTYAVDFLLCQPPYTQRALVSPMNLVTI